MEFFTQVWAAAAKVPSNPPTDFLWKEQYKFGAGPECTTILCKPSGQALAWYTPAHWNARLRLAWQELEPEEEIQENIQPATLIDQRDQEEAKSQQEADGTELTLSEALSQAQVEPATSLMEDDPPILLKREKKTPVGLFPARSPWSQSTSSPTHSDYSLSRPLSMGNDGSSFCRDARSQSIRPDTAIGTSRYKKTNLLGKSSGPRAKSSTRPTRSTGPNLGGVMYLSPPSPFGSPLQRYYANTSYNIKLPSQASFTPTIL
nr:PREDICTED: lamin tail domain-containing protein 1 [Latimeria chalumnae]|eukprot:XP_014341756.1 PREDICTED: lamin tail domain-containing protein 1 [Latimeria chalumnae]